MAATYNDSYLIKAVAATVVTLFYSLMLHSVLRHSTLLYSTLTGSSAQRSCKRLLLFS